MSEQTPPTLATAGSVPPDPDRSTPLERREGGDTTGATSRRSRNPFHGAAGRNIGLVIALALLCAVGVATAGERFASIDNLMTILRLAAVIGVLSIGMTFVITGGGIDLSVGSVLGLASVWASTLATQTMARDAHWGVMVFTALAVGLACGLVNGVLIAYGRVVAFIATLAMMVAARGLAEIIANRQTQIVSVDAFLDVFRADVLGVSVLVWIFAAVAVAGWVLLNRTTFGRRTIAVGGNPEAARLAGIKVRRHTMYLYGLAGLTAGIAAIMMLARTTSGSSTHGMYYELDAIAAVVVGGTLLAGGRGTIVGTVLGVLIFTTLTNVFTQNNLSISAQSVAKGVIIVAAVLLQQRFAARSRSA
ncbi:ABC transporter permease [Cellulomonas carbonis]|uniref:ABC transporter permease n=1 Tax=Cellulomonas carbonis TaxID=1386092 RepID=UPI0005B951E6|nr:sugar ABC transporter permease [Cellulomonas carbonis]